jgi:diacylglycerol kinase
MNSEKFSIRKRLQSFKYAINGIKPLIAEHNMRIHLVVALLVIILGFFLRISGTEWCVLTIVMALVISLEAINTAIEKLTDICSPNYSPQAKYVKDVAAAAVLISAIAAVIIGFIIFLPKILNYF